MKAKVYLRVARDSGARNPQRAKIQASATPNYTPLDARGDFLPTVMFAVEVDIPDKAFRQAEQVLAELVIDPDSVEVAAEVSYPDGED